MVEEYTATCTLAFSCGGCRLQFRDRFLEVCLSPSFCGRWLKHVIDLNSALPPFFPPAALQWSVANIHPTVQFILPIPSHLGGGLLYFAESAIVAVGGGGVRGRIKAEALILCGVTLGGGEGFWLLGGADGGVYRYVLWISVGGEWYEDCCWVVETCGCSAGILFWQLVSFFGRKGPCMDGRRAHSCTLFLWSEFCCFIVGSRMHPRLTTH